LSPGQEEEIKKILMKQSQQGLQMAQKMFGGNPAKEQSNVTEPPGDPEKEIQALLSPEQRAAYKEYKQEDTAANARLIANSEMLQMQNALGLTQEQQDKVFPILYEQSLKKVNPNPTDYNPNNTDPTSIVQKQFDEKLKALESVLSPEQLESYRRLQESQLKLIKSFMPT